MKFIYIITLYLLTLSGCTDKKVYPDRYCLDFRLNRETDFKWGVEAQPDYNKAMCGWDPFGGENGKGSFHISEHRSPIGGDSTLGLEFEIYQKITLYNDYEELEVGILKKTQKIDVAWLKITCLGENEDVLRKDSVNLNDGQGWGEVFLSIDLESTYYIIVSIYVNSLKNDKKDSRLLIDHISLYVDGDDINGVNHSDHKEIKLSPKNIIPLSITEMDNLLDIEMLSAKQHTIIGLGEAFHGSSTIQRVNNQVIKNMVLHNNCKLILLENPMDMTLKYNLFINGYDIDTEEFREEKSIVVSTIPQDAFIDLLDWLREYNTNNPSQKVQLVGLDTRIDNNDDGITSFLIQDYLFYLNKHQNAPILEELLYEYYMQGDRVYSFLEANQEELKKAMGDFEYKMFLNYFYINQNLSQIPGYEERGLANSRDYFMWLNFEYAIKAGLQNGEKAVVEGHWGHINKISVGNSTTHSLGYYINRHYGNKYKAIGVFGGEGQFVLATRDKRLQSTYLNKPPVGSFESAAMKLDVPYLFYPTSELPSTPLLMRFNAQGFVYNQFIENSVKARMDGILFIRKCETWTPNSSSNTLSVRNEIFNKRVAKMNERGDQLLEKRKMLH